MDGVKKESSDLQGPGVVNYVLEQLAEVTTVKNEHGVEEELYILYPPKRSEVRLESPKSNEESTDTTQARLRKRPDKFRDYVVTAKPEEKKTQEKCLVIQPKAEQNKVQDESSKSQSRTNKGKSAGQACPGKRGRPNKGSVDNQVGFECSACSKVFSLKGNLKVHMRIHNGDKPFVCSYKECAKAFRCKDALKKHSISHTGDKMWKCGTCSKGFSSKVSLIEHEARHSNTKAYKCGVCQMEFRQYSCMSRHLMTHKEEFPYVCSVCAKKFKMAIYLKSHMRVHTGETPYECSTCLKRFKHQSDLTRHKIIHSGTKPYQCKVCGVRFSDSSCRRRHEREHLTKSTFKCKLCGVTFKKIEKLKTHMISAHFCQEDTVGQSVITNLLKELDEMAYSKDSKSPCDFLQQNLPQETSTAAVTLPQAGNVLEKRMITHHVSVPRVQGQAVVIDPYSLLEHIKDQLDPSQMPQTINGEALQVCHNIIQDNNDHVIVELQYLSTVQVSSPDIGSSVACTTVEKATFNSEQFLPVHVENSTTLVQQDPAGVSSLSEVNTHSDFITTVSVDSASSDIENLGAFIDVSEMEERDGAFKGEETFTVAHSRDVKGGVDEQQSELSKTRKSLDLINSHLTASYIEFPDFSEQYYNWLQEFGEACKDLDIPLDQSVFETISSVNKKLADVMASPKGILTDKTKFVTCLSVSKQLGTIIESHHNYVLTCLNQNKFSP